jgi:hypothetical protein
MPKPVCVKCQCFYRPKTNGYFLTEMMPTGEWRGDPDEIRGNHRPEMWQPYKLWVADLWECPECAHQIVVGFGHGPVREHHEEDFEAVVIACSGDRLQVNDC